MLISYHAEGHSMRANQRANTRFRTRSLRVQSPTLSHHAYPPLIYTIPGTGRPIYLYDVNGDVAMGGKTVPDGQLTDNGTECQHGSTLRS